VVTICPPDKTLNLEYPVIYELYAMFPLFHDKLHVGKFWAAIDVPKEVANVTSFVEGASRPIVMGQWVKSECSP
jgi:hypothetical protein